MKFWWSSPRSPFDWCAQVAKRLCWDGAFASPSFASARGANAVETTAHAMKQVSLVFMGLLASVDRAAMRRAGGMPGQRKVKRGLGQNELKAENTVHLGPGGR